MKKIIIPIIAFCISMVACKNETDAKTETTTDTDKKIKKNTEKSQLKSALTLHASFDENGNADYAKGDKNIYTILKRKKTDTAKKGIQKEGVSISKTEGKYGGALKFADKTNGNVFYRSLNNIAYSKTDWSGSISFWLSLNPDKDLKPGYCDPIQITDSSYNDAAIWVDFTKTLPRKFRLGVIGDRDVWNPNPQGPDNESPSFLNQLLTAENTVFAANKWTHVVINFSNLNTANGKTQFYVDGKKVAERSSLKDTFSWNYKKSNIFIGLSYIGLFDDLSIFNRTLNLNEINQIYNSDKGIKSLLN